MSDRDGHDPGNGLHVILRSLSDRTLQLLDENERLRSVAAALEEENARRVEMGDWLAGLLHKLATPQHPGFAADDSVRTLAVESVDAWRAATGEDA